MSFSEFAYSAEDQGGIIVGQLTSYADFNGVGITAAGPSGFFWGFESVNSCLYNHATWVPTEETPNPYGTIVVTTTDLGDTTSNASESHTEVVLAHSVDFSVATFALSVEYTATQAPCSDPIVIAPVVADQ